MLIPIGIEAGRRRLSVSEDQLAALRIALELPDRIGLGLVAGCGDAGTPGDAVPPELVAASPGRQSSWRRGRRGAAAALAAIGIDAGALPIGADRLPLWPGGASGSISHSDTLAIAVAAPAGTCSAIGIDCEPLASEVHMTEIAAILADADERAHLGFMPPASALLVAFCVKEALFKALRPDRFVDFTAARVVMARAGRCSLRLAVDWSPRDRAGAIVEARWARGFGHVVALVSR